MIKLIPFKAWHIMALNNRDHAIKETFSRSLVKENGGPAFTALLNNIPIGCAGVIIMWPGVGIAWAAFTHEIIDHKIWVSRHVKNALRDIIRSHSLHRVEAVSLAENDKNAQWLELLGFTREKDIAQQYTQDKRDVYRYEYIVPSSLPIREP